MTSLVKDSNIALRRLAVSIEFKTTIINFKFSGLWVGMNTLSKSIGCNNQKDPCFLQSLNFHLIMPLFLNISAVYKLFTFVCNWRVRQYQGSNFVFRNCYNMRTNRTFLRFKLMGDIFMIFTHNYLELHLGRWYGRDIIDMFSPGIHYFVINTTVFIKLSNIKISKLGFYGWCLVFHLRIALEIISHTSVKK